MKLLTNLLQTYSGYFFNNYNPCLEIYLLEVSELALLFLSLFYNSGKDCILINFFI